MNGTDIIRCCLYGANCISIESLEPDEVEQVQMRYQKYQKETYIPQPHYKRED